MTEGGGDDDGDDGDGGDGGGSDCGRAVTRERRRWPERGGCRTPERGYPDGWVLKKARSQVRRLERWQQNLLHVVPGKIYGDLCPDYISHTV